MFLVSIFFFFFLGGGGGGSFCCCVSLFCPLLETGRTSRPDKDYAALKSSSSHSYNSQPARQGGTTLTRRQAKVRPLSSSSD